MLRAVTFDLWETLIHEDASTEDQRRAHRVREAARILQAGGLAVAPDALERAHREVIARMDPYWGANLDLSVVEQTKIFLELATGFSIDGKLPPAALLEASKHYGEAAQKFPPRAADGVRAVLAAARAAGMRMALLCNTGRTPGKVLREILAMLDLKSFFEVLCFSDELRLRKPAAEFFTRVLTRLGVRPEEAVHVGDRAETDLAGARAAGMRTVYLRLSGAPEAPAGMADHTIATIQELPEVLGRLINASAPSRTDSTTAVGRPSDFGKDTTHL